MNKCEKLSRVRSLVREIELLKNQLEYAENAAETNMAVDSVKGSMPEHPYIECVIKIAGVDIKDYESRVKSLRTALDAKNKELVQAVNTAEEYILTLDDVETRMILHCKYINGFTWERIESELGISYRTAQRKFKKWLNCR